MPNNDEIKGKFDQVKGKVKQEIARWHVHRLQTETLGSNIASHSKELPCHCHESSCLPSAFAPLSS